RLDITTHFGIPARKSCTASLTNTSPPTAPTWPGPYLSISTALGFRPGRLLGDHLIGIRRRMLAELLDHRGGFFGLVLTDDDGHAAYSGVYVLGCVQTLNIRVNTR